MREIKFRLFHKSKATVVYFKLPGVTFTNGFWEGKSPFDNYELFFTRSEVNLSGLTLSGYNHPDFNKTIDEDDYILMQYTGMKDHNGKEIYEGDIVKGPYGEEKTRIVEWEDGDNAYSFLEYYEFAENFEIIGNVYSTPELIKNV